MGNPLGKKELRLINFFCHPSARTLYVTAEFAMIVKYKMADANPDILFDSVHFLLNNWPVLQIAVQHGFGGKDSQEKADWLVSVIDQVLRENGEHKSVFLPSYFLRLNY